MKKISKKAIFSFFSGSGLMDLGFENAGFDIDFVNEYHLPFLNAYKFSREKLHLRQPKFGYNNTDIRDYLSIREEELFEHIRDLRMNGAMIGFIGGPPCPDFSIAGKQLGQDGERGQLSQTYIELIIKFMPDFFVFENVKGLWITEKHRKFFEKLKMRLWDSSYVTTERLCNAYEFGAPQDRERILLFGIKSKLLNDKNITGHLINNFNWTKYAQYTVKEIKQVNWPTTSPFIVNSVIENPNPLYAPLTVEYWFEKNDVMNHPNSDLYFTPRAGLARMMTIEEGDTSRKCYKRLHRWRYSPTVAYGNNEVHLHPYKERRLSVAEALALQSLPMNFILPQEMTLSDMFKTIGNGVPYLLALNVATAINDYLDEALWNE